MSTSIIAELCLYLLTWNVATKHPSDLSLSNLLGLNGTTSCPDGRLPDIYAITLQEVSTKPKNQILGLFQDDQWTFKVRDALNEYEYVKIETEQLQGILIMIFAQRQHIPHMKNIQTANTRTGLGGVWGNKGAVSVRMSLYGTGVTFVGSHLAAHDEKLKERVEDYNTIVNSHHYDAMNYRSIFDHDFVFWFGDLNFRLTGEESAWDIRTAVENGRLEELIEKDQLKLVRETGNAFSLLHEELPKFPPTFKFNEDTSEYNLKRRPAWCDRILYRVQEDKYPEIKLSLQQLSYKSHPDYTMSDHKPVTAEFLFKIEAQRVTDEELHEMTHGGSDSSEVSVIILLASVIIVNMF